MGSRLVQIRGSEYIQNMKPVAPVTFWLGLGVLLLGLVQLLLTREPVRLATVAIGLAVVVLGWRLGWLRYRRFTILLGHLVLTAGCFAVAWAVYQIPFLKSSPSLLQILDLPLFWGLFTVCGGWCMITHGYCRCANTLQKDFCPGSSKQRRLT